MTTDFRTPSKKEIQARYQISEDDFEVLVSQSEPKSDDQTLLQSVGNWTGIKTWLRKTKAGRVVAVIFFVSAGITDLTKLAAKPVEAGKVMISWLSPFGSLPPAPLTGSEIHQYANVAVTSSVVSVGTFPAANNPPDPEPFHVTWTRHV